MGDAAPTGDRGVDALGVDNAFRAVRSVRAIERLGAAIGDADTWRSLAPSLTISDRPPLETAPPAEDTWAASTATSAALIDEGYVIAPAMVPASLVARVRSAIDALVARGLPPNFVLMFDEPYALFAGLARALAPVLGPGARLLSEDLWAFHVPPADAAVGMWTALPEHRDWLHGADPRVMAGELPGSVVVWVALTDVTPDDSCLYVVPAHADRGYRSGRRTIEPGDFRYQDIRAVPMSAGQALVFSNHLAHWGSRSSARARGPRQSLSAFIQRADATNRLERAVELDAPVPVADRLRWVLESLRLLVHKEVLKSLADRAGVTLTPPPSGGDYTSVP
jgi:hypothetical protein